MIRVTLYTFLTLYACLQFASADEPTYNKPVHPQKIQELSADLSLKAAQHAYKCSYSMTVSESGLYEEGQFLRWYAQQFTKSEIFKASGKNWNDVSFPASMDILIYLKKSAKEKNITVEIAARNYSIKSADCKNLYLFAQGAIGVK